MSPARRKTTTSAPVEREVVVPTGSDEAATQAQNDRDADESMAGDDGLDEQIRRRAYALYLARGSSDGSDVEDWIEAERQIRFGRSATEGHAPSVLERLDQSGERNTGA